MRKNTKLTWTVRLDVKTLRALQSIRHGYKSAVIRELVANNPKTIKRYTTRAAA